VRQVQEAVQPLDVVLGLDVEEPLERLLVADPRQLLQLREPLGRELLDEPVGVGDLRGRRR
jgi:hypothetical protein